MTNIRSTLRTEMLLQRRAHKRIAEAAGVSSADVSQMLCGKRAISPRVALGFEVALGVPAEEQKRERLDVMLARLAEVRARAE
jgi:DNA-binding transcriptional regulator YdaS (Cro superfamily)